MTVLAIAHRAGNTDGGARAALAAGADVLEADVHRYGGRLELRHSKALRPLPLLYDERRLRTRRPAPPLLPWLLELVGDRAVLLLDLKGPGHVGRHVADALRAHTGPPVLVCSRWWPGVDALADVAPARRVLTARTARELARLRRRLREDRGVHGVSLHRSLVAPDVVDELRGRVEVVMTWPVADGAALAGVLADGVNGVITDEADVLGAVLARGAGARRSIGGS